MKNIYFCEFVKNQKPRPMKKTIILMSAIVSVAFLVSCGGSKKEDKKDEGKTDSTVVEEKAPVKDFNYFNALVKNLKIEGLELSSSNASSDTTDKWFYYGFSIKDAKEKGADKININVGNVKKLGNKDDVVVASLADFEKAQRRMVEKEGVTCSDFKEWKNGEEVIYYYTVKGKSDQMGGQKNYNQLFASYVLGDMYFSIMVSVYDNTASMEKAEEILKQIMETMTK